MLVPILTGLTYILRESFKRHLFVVSVQSYRERYIIIIIIIKKANLLVFFFMEKEEHGHSLSDVYTHGPALFPSSLKPRMSGSEKV